MFAQSEVQGPKDHKHPALQIGDAARWFVDVLGREGIPARALLSDIEAWEALESGPSDLALNR